MTDSDYVPFLINDRSSALLHLIDAFQLTESELSDIYDGVFNRMKEHFAPNNTDKPLTPYDVKAVREYVATLKLQPLSQETQDWMQERFEDDRDPSEKPCPCGEGTTTLRDCDGRPCGFIEVIHDDYVDDFE